MMPRLARVLCYAVLGSLPFKVSFFKPSTLFFPADYVCSFTELRCLTWPVIAVLTFLSNDVYLVTILSCYMLSILDLRRVTGPLVSFYESYTSSALKMLANLIESGFIELYMLTSVPGILAGETGGDGPVIILA